MYKRFSFTTSSIVIICMVFLFSGCKVKNPSLKPLAPLSISTVDTSDSCNQQVQAIVKNSALGSAFRVEDELNDRFNQSMATIIPEGGFDFSQWLSGEGEQHINTLSQNGGVAKLMKVLNDTAKSDARAINILNHNIVSLTRCRQEQGKSITSQLQTRNQLAMLQNRIDRDNKFIGKLLEQSDKRVSIYQDTLKKLEGLFTTPSNDDASTRYSVGSLNVRSQPSTSGAIIGKLKRGETFKVEQDEGHWLRINHHGQQGYISASFTRKKSVTSNKVGQSRAMNKHSGTANNVQQAKNAQLIGLRKNEELAGLKKN